MYYLMNKDKIVAKYEIEDGLLGSSYVLKEQIGKLPIGYKNFESWVENRKASKHNHHLRKIMQMCGCLDTSGFIKVTHAASINDTFWVKSENENIFWKDVSFYNNPFNEVISKLAFEGLGLYGIQLSDTSPELSTEGSFRKCWIREEDGIYLFKRGETGFRNVGLEPYSEAMASEIANKLCHSVKYTLAKLHGEIASKCRLFTNEETGYVPISKYNLNYSSPDKILEFFASIGAEDDFRRMLVLDAVVFNVDRHAGNYGFLVDNDSLETIGMAPVFDFNLCLFPYWEMEDFNDVGTKMLECGPRIGDDFIRVGQSVLTPEIRADLINLKGFQFSFRGDEKYSMERVRAIEDLVNRQIDALLDKNILHTKDVFTPKQIEEEMAEDKELNEDIDKFAQQIINKGIASAYEIDDKIVVFYVTEDKTEIIVNMESHEIWAEKDGKVLNNYDILNFPITTKSYSDVAKLLDGCFSEERDELLK